MSPLPLKLPNFRGWWDSLIAFFHAIFKPKPFRPRMPTIPEGTESTELNEFGFVSVPGFPLPAPRSDPAPAVLQSNPAGPENGTTWLDIPDRRNSEEELVSDRWNNCNRKRTGIVLLR